MPDKLPTETAAVEKEKPSEEKQKEIQLAAEGKISWRGILSSNKTWVTLILLVILFILTAFVPVAKIPGLRNLAYAMGYSEEETEDISFLRALFSWNEHSKNRSGELSRDELLASGDLARLAQEGKDVPNQTDDLLFNFRAVNTSLRRKGQKADTGISQMINPGASEDAPGVKVTSDTTVTSGNTVPAEVYFGEEANLVERDKNDGYNTSKMLAKIKNPYTINSSGHDWLTTQAQHAFWADSDIEHLMNNLNSKTPGGARLNSNLSDTSEKKSHRDVYYAWLTSNAGRRTPDLWLKKTLAAAGFMGADLDRQKLVFNGFGGMKLDEDAIMADMENIEARKKIEKQCEDSLSTSGEALKEILKNADSGISAIAGAFPKSCDELGGGFESTLQKVETQCKQAENSYKELKQNCQTTYTTGNCNLPDLRARYTSYETYCLEEAKKCGEIPNATEEDIKKCLNSRKKAEECTGDQCGCTGNLADGSGCDPAALNQLVDNTAGKNSGFMPGVDKESVGSQSWIVDVNNFK